MNQASSGEPREGVEVGSYVDKWSAKVDKYGHVRAATNKHRRAHRCDAFPTSHRGARLQSAVARFISAHRVLEVGCGLGYSALWYAEAIAPSGVIETVERDEAHKKLAEANFRAEGLVDNLLVHLGEASEILPTLQGSYDLISLDSDWIEYPLLFSDFMRLLRRGGVLISSNLFPGTHSLDVGGLEEVAVYRGLIETDERLLTTYVSDGKALSFHR